MEEEYDPLDRYELNGNVYYIPYKSEQIGFLPIKPNWGDDEDFINLTDFVKLLREQIARENIEKILALIPQYQGLYADMKKITPEFLDERIAECFEVAADALRNETYHEKLVRLGLPTTPQEARAAAIARGEK